MAPQNLSRSYAPRTLHCEEPGSSGPERVQHAPQRLGIHVAIEADTAPAAKLDLNDAGLALTPARKLRRRRRPNGRKDLNRDQLR